MTEHGRDEQPADDARARRAELRRFVREHEIRTRLRSPRTHREIAVFRETVADRWPDRRTETDDLGEDGDRE